VVVCENAWMLVAMRFVISLARNRACSILWNLQGFPGHLPVLMHENPAVQKSGLQLWFIIHVVELYLLPVLLVCLRLSLAAGVQGVTGNCCTSFYVFHQRTGELPEHGRGF
jgi:hypothetical protein